MYLYTVHLCHVLQVELKNILEVFLLLALVRLKNLWVLNDFSKIWSDFWFLDRGKVLGDLDSYIVSLG